MLEVDVVVHLQPYQELLQHHRGLRFPLAPEVIGWMIYGNGLEPLTLVHAKHGTTAAGVWAGRGTRSGPDDDAAAEDDAPGCNGGIC